MPAVGIVIPTYRPRCLESTIDGLAQQSSRDFEVIIVENGERTDRTWKMLDRYRTGLPLRYYFVPRLGLNHARNHGVRRCQSPIVALLDDDCIPEKDWVGGILAAHGRFPQAGVIGGRVSLSFEEARPDWLCDYFRRQLSEIDFGPGERLLTKEYLVGANLSCRRRIYDAVEGFNENIGMVGRDGPQLCNDELDFIQRARMIGNPGAVYDGRIRVHHTIPARRTTIEYFENRAFGQGLSDVVLQEQACPARDSLRRLLIEKLHLQTGHWARLNQVLAGLQSPARETCRRHYARCRLAYLEGMIHRLDLIEGDRSVRGCSKERIGRRGFQAILRLKRRTNRQHGYDLLAKRLERWSVGRSSPTTWVSDYEAARARVFFLAGMRSALSHLEELHTDTALNDKKGGDYHTS